VADALTIGTAISVTQSARSVLPAAGLGANRVGAVTLDNQLAPNIFSEARIVLGGAQAQTALSLAVLSGHGIVAALKALQSSAALAGHESLVSPLTNLTISGTRISRLNLHSDANRALSLIDNLVQQSEFANANFISSNGANIQLKTTRFGGSINIAPQPLNSAGLNLKNINLLTQAGAEDAAARLQLAINSATRRVGSLGALQQALTNSDFTGAALSALISNISGDGLPVGSLVNVVG
jgi:hypothetical protein